MAWPIVRSDPPPPSHGLAIPCFIRNGQYFLSTLDVYEDGAINAWGFLDRALFEEKARKRWAVSSVPDGGQISVHNLGQFIASQGEWLREDLRPEVDRYLEGRTGLLDMHGVDWVLQGNVRYAKMGLGNGLPFREGTQILGDRVWVFHVDGEVVRLRALFVFADGTARIGTDGKPLTLDALPGLFASGALRTEVPDGTRIAIDDVGTVVCESSHWCTRPFERMWEILDLERRLNGAPSVVEQCARAFAAWREDPSAENLGRLKTAYEAVPEHLRMYCGDMDEKDGPIRAALRSWSL